MIAFDSHSLKDPSTSVGTIALGLSATKSGERRSPAKKSWYSISISRPRWLMTASTLRPFGEPTNVCSFMAISFEGSCLAMKTIQDRQTILKKKIFVEANLSATLKRHHTERLSL